MQLTLPFEVLCLAKLLNDHNFEAYLVGGAVRDLFIAHSLDSANQPPLIMDYDLTTNATPDQIKQLLPDSYYENQFGTVSLTHKSWLDQLALAKYQVPVETMQTQLTNLAVNNRQNRLIDLARATKIHTSLKPVIAQDDAPQNLDQILVHPFEITTFRTDGTYEDHRRPSAVTWGKSIQDDLMRRDFTINAIAIKLDSKWLDQNLKNLELNSTYSLTEVDFEIIDPHHGRADIEAKIIQTVGDANERFREDALRMLRAIRLSVQLDISISPDTLAAISQNHQLLGHVSGERIRDEFLKMLQSHQPDKAIEIMAQTGLLSQFLPELVETQGVEQGGHHTTDVWTHSLDALASCPSFDPIVRLATLLHDIAKPATYESRGGQITFYNHEIIGSRMASQIGQRLRLSRKQRDRLFLLVRQHMFHYQPQNTDSSVRRFMRNVGLENIDDILDLREGDRLGSGARKTSWRLEEFKDRMIDQLNQPLDVTDLAINGTDLMRELNLKPGPILGKILQNLFDLVMDDPELNDKQVLLTKAKELLK